jgi:hypothetical protein
VLRDPLDPHRDRIAEAVAAAAPSPHERRAQLVEFVELALETARRQQALEDVPEADEEPGADEARDLAVPRLVPAALEQRVLEQPGEADVVCEVLDVRRLPLPRRGELGELGEVVGTRVSPRPSSWRSARWTTRSG